MKIICFSLILTLSCTYAFAMGPKSPAELQQLENNSNDEAKAADAQKNQREAEAKQIEKQIGAMRQSLANAPADFQKNLDSMKKTSGKAAGKELGSILTGTKTEGSTKKSADSAVNAAKFYAKAQEAAYRPLDLQPKITDAEKKLAAKREQARQAGQQAQGAKQIAQIAREQRVQMEKAAAEAAAEQQRQQVKAAADAAEQRRQHDREMKELHDAMSDRIRDSGSRSIERQQRDTHDFEHSHGRDDNGNPRA